MRFKDLQAKISIHALRVEGDSPKCTKNQTRHCISIHALRVEGDYLPPFIPIVYHISIHALRVEGDATIRAYHADARPNFYPRPPGGGRRWCAQWNDVCQYISIHALRVEGDAMRKASNDLLFIFLSTPSAWRATYTGRNGGDAYFSISIHALRVEGDIQPFRLKVHTLYFYPRPPGGGRHCIYFTGYSDK